MVGIALITIIEAVETNGGIKDIKITFLTAGIGFTYRLLCMDWDDE
jgi:hypothetical protein